MLRRTLLRALPALGTLPLALLPLGLAACGGPVAEQGLVIQGHTSDPTRPYYHDFGAVPHGESVAHTFELLNTDAREVTIKSVTPACSCTVGKIYCLTGAGERIEGDMRATPVLVVPSRARAFLEFRLDSRQVPERNVDKLVLVSLSCDSPSTPYVRFELHTIVEVPLQATPHTLELADVPQSAGGQGLVQLAAARPGSLVQVTGIAMASEWLDATVEEVDVLGRRGWNLSVALEPGAPMGIYQGEVELAVTGEDGEGEGRPFGIPVRARVVEDVVVLPGVLAFARFQEGTARAEGLLQALVPGDRVKVTGAEITDADAEGLSVELEPLSPDALGRSARWRVAVVAPAELEGRVFGGTVALTLDHPTVPTVEARFVGRPR